MCPAARTAYSPGVRTRGVVLAVEALLDVPGATARAVSIEGLSVGHPRYERPLPGEGAVERLGAARDGTIQPYADARPALDHLLAAGIRVAVLVRREDPVLRRGLERLALDERGDHRVLVLGPDDLAGPVAGPATGSAAASGLCRAACAALGTRLDETVVVGDAPLVQGALQAGLQGRVDRPGRPPRDGGCPDHPRPGLPADRARRPRPARPGLTDRSTPRDRPRRTSSDPARSPGYLVRISGYAGAIRVTRSAGPPTLQTRAFLISRSSHHTP